MTRGQKSSERKAAYTAFLGGFLLACYGIHEDADLTALGVLIGSVTLPLMAYGGFRTTFKTLKQGEDNV